MSMREAGRGKMERQEAVVLAGGAARAGVARKAADAYQQAFIEAYECHYTKLFAYVYSRVGNVELAKDLTAEVFEKAYVKGHGVRGAAASTTWLFMIARNVVIGHYRRQKRENGGLAKIKDSLWLSERPTDPEADTLRVEAGSNLVRPLTRLPDGAQG